MGNILFIPKNQEDSTIIKKQLKEMGVTNVVVLDEKHYTESDYDMAFHDVIPNKEFGYIMDFGQNVKRLGTSYDKYSPPVYNEDDGYKKVREALEDVSYPHLATVMDDNNRIYEVSREWYEAEINSIENDTRKYSEMDSVSLKKRFDVSNDIESVIAMGLAFALIVHCEPMKDRWNNDSMGYMAVSYDKEKKKEVYKPVVGFYNAKTLSWISEDAISLFSNDDWKDNHKKWLSAYKTKIRNIVNNKKSIYAIKFFANFLKEKHLEQISIDEVIKSAGGEENYHVLPSPRNDNGAKISVIDEGDIPF